MDYVTHDILILKGFQYHIICSEDCALLANKCILPNDTVSLGSVSVNSLKNRLVKIASFENTNRFSLTFFGPISKSLFFLNTKQLKQIIILTILCSV